jgi:hypothetical protein
MGGADESRECALELVYHVHEKAREAESASALCHNGLLDEPGKLGATSVAVSDTDLPLQTVSISLIGLQFAMTPLRNARNWSSASDVYGCAFTTERAVRRTVRVRDANMGRENRVASELTGRHLGVLNSDLERVNRADGAHDHLCAHVRAVDGKAGTVAPAVLEAFEVIDKRCQDLVPGNVRAVVGVTENAAHACCACVPVQLLP